MDRPWMQYEAYDIKVGCQKKLAGSCQLAAAWPGYSPAPSGVGALSAGQLGCHLCVVLEGLVTTALQEPPVYHAPLPAVGEQRDTEH